MPGGFSVFAGVGERTREGNDLYREMIESGVIKLGDKQVFFSSFFFQQYRLICSFKLIIIFYDRARASVL